MKDAFLFGLQSAWDWMTWAALWLWAWLTAAVVHSPKIAAGAILGGIMAIYFGYATLPIKSDPVLATQMLGLKHIVDDLSATVASRDDIAVLSARIGALEHPKPSSAPLVTGSISKSSKK